MPSSPHEAVLQEDIDIINSYSSDDIFNYRHEYYRNLFLLAARNGKVKAAKAIIKKIEELENPIVLKLEQTQPLDIINYITVDIQANIIKFITAKDNVSSRNAWTLAAIADSQYFLAYLNSLKEKYKDSLKGWDEFQYDLDGKRTIAWAIDREAHDATYYLLSRGTFAELCAIGSCTNIRFIVDDFKKMDIVDQAVILLATNSQGMNPLEVALHHQYYDIADIVYNLIYNWFEDIKNKADEFKERNDILNQMNQLYLDEYLDEVDLSTKSKRNTTSNSLILARGGDQSLKYPKIFNSIESRHYRSFKNERERQLLRQIGTQIYYGFQLSAFKPSDLVEVQLMHLNYQGRHNLFIAANEGTVTSDLYKYLANTPLKNILTTAYSPSKNKEGRLRSKRYASKLLVRLYGQQIALPNSCYDSDTEHTNKVADILLKSNIKLLPISLIEDYGKGNILNGLKLTSKSKTYIRHALKQDYSIYILEVKKCPHKERHAEEFLVDIRDFIEDNNNLYSCIGGKKRPCIGCSGRMENRINQYNKYPGGFWVNTIEYQSPHVAKSTIKLLFTKPTHVSRLKDLNEQKNIEDHDSGSDSDAPTDTLIV